MKSHSFILLFSLLFIHTVCFGQNDWKPGCVIKTSGDSILGFIDNRDSKTNSKECYFRKDEKSETQVFTPDQIAGYRLTNSKYFISKVIDGQNSGKTVFLEFLIQGKLNVYHYSEEKEHYFVEKDSKMYELKNTETQKLINKAEYIKQNKEYIGLLTYLLNDAHIQTNISTSKLSAKSLIGIAKEYHEKVCKDESCIVYEMNITPVHTVLGIHAGGSFNSINFGDLLISNYALSSIIGIKVEFENILSWKENLSFVVDFNLNKLTNYKLSAISDYESIVKYNNESYNLSKNHTHSNLNVDIKTYMLRIPLTLNYTQSKGTVRPYFGVGILNSIVLSQNKDFIYQNTYDVYNQSIPTYQAGFIVRAGRKYMLPDKQALYAELNYEYSQSFSINASQRFYENLFSLTAGYAF